MLCRNYSRIHRFIVTAFFRVMTAGIFCRLQVAGCRLKFHYNWKTAGTKKKGKAIDLP